jgi:hypothetical protein
VHPTEEDETAMSLKKEKIADDLIFGVSGDDGIAAELGLTPGQVYHLISQGKIPVTKMGHRSIFASRKKLRQIFTGEKE